MRRGTVKCGYASCAAAFGESECSDVNQQCRLSGLQPTAPACATSRLKNGVGHPLRFIDLHRKVLTFRTSARPFRRCLVFQARFAAKQALAEGRFNEQHLAEMAPYLVSVSPQASNIEVREDCCGIADAQCRHGCSVHLKYSSSTTQPCFRPCHVVFQPCNICFLADVLAEDAR